MNSVRQSLYLKYRPQRFGELVGQEVVARTLRNSVRERRFAHAYLFTGIRGTGKTSAARILARAINCETPDDGEPCGSCRACQSVGAGRSLDVIEIDAATNNGIDNIRDLRERAQFLPSELRMKVYIIDEAHGLSRVANEAFLKTLEEPPEHACFILATTKPEELAETILSRCQRFDFRRIPVGAMAGHLAGICQQEGVTTTNDVMQLVAEAGAGSLRDAESLLDRLIGTDDGVLDLDSVRAALGMADPAALGRLAESLSRGELAQAWTELHQLSAAGVEPRQLLRALGALARDRQWASLAAGGTRGSFWLDLMEACAQGGNQIRRADDPWMALEVILLRAGDAVSGSATRPPIRANPAPPDPRPVALGRPPAPAPALLLSPPAPTGVAVAADSSGPAPRTAAVGGQRESSVVAPAPVVTDWQRRWAGVTQWAQLHHPGPFAALVRETGASALSDGTLTIEVRFPWHLAQLRTPAYRPLVEQACREVMGEGLTVELVLAGDPTPPAPTEVGEEPNALALALKHFPGSTVRKVDFHDPTEPGPVGP